MSCSLFLSFVCSFILFFFSSSHWFICSFFPRPLVLSFVHSFFFSSSSPPLVCLFVCSFFFCLVLIFSFVCSIIRFLSSSCPLVCLFVHFLFPHPVILLFVCLFVHSFFSSSSHPFVCSH